VAVLLMVIGVINFIEVLIRISETNLREELIGIRLRLAELSERQASKPE
jgi:hypothetical protein